MKEVQTAAEPAPSILVLTDFSEASKEALRWAAHMATNLRADLQVLYPYRLVQLNGNDDLIQLRKNIENEARTNFAKLVDTVLKDLQPRYDFRAEIGFINDRVYSYTRKRDHVLLVVISKKMANTNQDAFNELIDNLSTPLLIVPQAGLSIRSTLNHRTKAI